MTTLRVFLFALALEGLWLLRRHRAVRQVPADMRAAILYFPFSIRNGLELRLVRAFRLGELPVRAGVAMERARTDAGVEVLVYRREHHQAGAGGLLWIHGGGFVVGSAGGYHDICSRFAKDLGITVVSVEYRLAPEHPFPAGLDDCMEALRWMHAHGDDLGIASDRIAVGGDSAGGGLAAAVAQRAHDEAEVPLCFQLLVYPMLDDRTAQRRDHGDRGRLIWSPASNRFAWQRYLAGSRRDGVPPAYAAPARREDLAGLPPAWIGVGTLDLFHDEDVRYAERLRAAGVACELLVVPGMYHGADSFAWRTSAAARDFGDRIISSVGEALASH